jgi:hypothetical protein
MPWRPGLAHVATNSMPISVLGSVDCSFSENQFATGLQNGYRLSLKPPQVTNRCEIFRGTHQHDRRDHPLDNCASDHFAISTRNTVIDGEIAFAAVGSAFSARGNVTCLGEALYGVQDI